MNSKIAETIENTINAREFAIGNDLVFIPDFKHSITEEFKSKVYTADEIAYCARFEDSLLRYASTWAAKEAVYKAVKQVTEIKLPFKKIEILRDKIAGRPRAVFHASEIENLSVSLSISHDGDYAWAIAIINKIS